MRKSWSERTYAYLCCGEDLYCLPCKKRRPNHAIAGNTIKPSARLVMNKTMPFNIVTGQLMISSKQKIASAKKQSQSIRTAFIFPFGLCELSTKIISVIHNLKSSTRGIQLKNTEKVSCEIQDARKENPRSWRGLRKSKKE